MKLTSPGKGHTNRGDDMCGTVKKLKIEINESKQFKELKFDCNFPDKPDQRTK